jgi:hypothetical protein
VSLHAAATTSIAQIPATARPRLRTELPNTLSSPEDSLHRPASVARPRDGPDAPDRHRYDGPFSGPQY